MSPSSQWTLHQHSQVTAQCIVSLTCDYRVCAAPTHMTMHPASIMETATGLDCSGGVTLLHQMLHRTDRQLSSNLLFAFRLCLYCFSSRLKYKFTATVQSPDCKKLYLSGSFFDSLGNVHFIRIIGIIRTIGWRFRKCLFRSNLR